MSDLTRAEKNVFGEHAERDEKTGEIVETGIGADFARTQAEKQARAAEREAAHQALVKRAEDAEKAVAESEAARHTLEADLAAAAARAEKAEAELAAKPKE